MGLDSRVLLVEDSLTERFSWFSWLRRYLVSFIIQFQFYKSACIKAGQYDATNPELPLDNCDIYGSAAAGAAFQ